MNVTADQRRTVLKLFNISESARLLGWAKQEMFSRIRSGKLPSPQIPLGKRFTSPQMICNFSASKVHKKKVTGDLSSPMALIQFSNFYNSSDRSRRKKEPNV